MHSIRCLPAMVAQMLIYQFLHQINGEATFYETRGDKMPGQYIVKFKEHVQHSQAITSTIESTGGELHEDHILLRYPLLNGMCIKLPAEKQSAEKMLRMIKTSDVVKYVEEDEIASINNLESWGLDRIDQRDLPLNNGTRNYIGNGANVHVYILDTGVRYNHPDFADRTGNGYDAFNDSSDIGMDCNSHGTHVAGIAVGSTYGVATGAIVHDVRVLDCSAWGPFGIIIKGMEWVAENHIKPAIASMSLGGGRSQAMNDAVQILVDSGVVVSTSAGNLNFDACVSSPASAPNGITVGATTIDDERALFSNYGECIDIFAPGMDIPSAHYLSDTVPLVYSGTSMACPMVSGAAAILLGNNPALSPHEVSDLLLRGATRNKVIDVHFRSPNRLLYIGEDTCMTRCGSEPDPTRGCQCDSMCSQLGNCCEDYTYLCWQNSPTCSERCGDVPDAVTFPCQCDEACVTREDCCQDYVIECQSNISCDITHHHGGIYLTPYALTVAPKDRTCRTVIKIPDESEHNAVLIQFSSYFNPYPRFEPHQGACNNDGLTIHDGDSENSPVIFTICGKDAPFQLLTKERSATVVLRTDSIDENFLGYWYNVFSQKVPEVTAPGIVMSDNFPEDYNNNTYAITRISTIPGEEIVLNFTHFNVESSDGVCRDRLLFHNNVYLLQHEYIGRACGNTSAHFSPLKSRGNSLALIMLTDASTTRQGFRAEVTSVSSCDSNLTPPGVISSSNFPSNYYNNERCYTKIEGTNERRVGVTFTSFNLQDARENGQCNDYIKAYDGDIQDENAVIGVFCGSSFLQLVSSGTTLLIEFSSDLFFSYRGYQADVKYIEERQFTAPNTITSHNFPANYNHDSFIVTKISTSPDKQMILDFSEFDIAGELVDSQLVCHDSLSVYDSDKPSIQHLIAQACTAGEERIPMFSPFRSSGSALTLVFVSDSSIARQGYQATVTSINPCKSVVNSPGVISSSNYPSRYNNNERCHIEIQTRCGKQIAITFSDFELSGRTNGQCLHDYLKVYEVDDTDQTTLIGEFCGSAIPPPIRSIGTKLLVEFVSDQDTSFKGYSADISFMQAVTAKLVGGITPSQGRVEIEHNKYGKGSVCNYNWDIKDASVVCKMVGYGAARNVRNINYFVGGGASVILDDVRCSGTEYNIGQCIHSSWQPGVCRNGHEAGAVCYQKGEVPLPVRLLDGDSPNAGRIELRIGVEWGTICNSSWDLIDAHVACRSVGYTGAEKVLASGEVPSGDITYPIFFSDVKCNGDESGIEFCLHSGVRNNNCDHSQDVGVQCIVG